MINEHRKIGKELNLFDLDENSNGMVLWKPKGFYIYNKIESFLRNILNEYNHEEVKSPIIAKDVLWEKSGHLDKYKKNMFLLNIDNNDYAIKPMNCPFHIEIFNSEQRSYKNLPIRFVEFGLCHRNEPSGSLNGLFRLREFNQDDGHIFCQEEQIKSELKLYMELLFKVYKKFGFNKDRIKVKVSLRPEKRIGSDQLWDVAEKYLMGALSEMKIHFDVLENEGAFYGPKIEVSLKDSKNREWQCGTFQLDFFLAEKLSASFINKNGELENPIILHRAILGSMERFIAILIEHYNGVLPMWLNPNAIKILPINDAHIEESMRIKKELKRMGISAEIDCSNNSLSFKIRNSFKNKSNYSIIIGDEEIRENKLNIRNKKGKLEIESINELLSL